MAYVIEDPANPPSCEPVALADMKTFLRVNWTTDDAMITGLIQAAREVAEAFCRKSFVQKGYIQFLDSFPYFTDTMMSQMAYPPSYYSLPRYSTTLWNYSQMIKLFYGPLVSVSELRYVSSETSTWETLTVTTDVSNPTGAQVLADVNSEPPRIFPRAGQFWPPVLYVPNSVEIHYQSGYPSSATPPAADGVPQAIKTAIMMLVANWYENREAASPLTLKSVPSHVEALLWTHRCMDLAATRG